MLSVGSIIAFYTPPVSVLWWFRRFCSSPCHVWKVTVSGTRNTRMEVFLSCLPNPDIAFCSSLKTCNFCVKLLPWTRTTDGDALLTMKRRRKARRSRMKCKFWVKGRSFCRVWVGFRLKTTFPVHVSFKPANLIDLNHTLHDKTCPSLTLSLYVANQTACSQ